MFRQDSFFFKVGVDRSRQRCAKTCQMGPTVPLGDVVGITKNILLVGVIPLQCNFNPDVVFNGVDVNDNRVQRLASLVQVFDKRRNSAGVFERIRTIVTLINQVNS